MQADPEQFYTEHAHNVYLYLMTLCNEPDTAEELMQETFLQAMRSLGRFRGDCTVYAWLCAIAKNLWHAELRRRKLHPSAEADPQMPDPARPPDEAAESRAIAVEVLQKLHHLPEQDKELILLRDAAGLSFRMIGEIFGRSENWARVNCYRAKQKLKKGDDNK